MSLIHIHMNKSVLKKGGFIIKQNQGESRSAGVLKYLRTFEQEYLNKDRWKHLSPS